jgi:uncharacterized protein YjbI with pentapeptide repeats
MMMCIADPSSTQHGKPWWRRTGPWLIVTLVGVGMLAALALALVVLPPRLVPTPAHATTFADLARAQSDARGNLVAALGVLAVLIGGVVGFLNFRENQQQNLRTIELNRETLEVTERGQVSERFSKAIDQLGDERLDVRIGAIYALAQIAHDSAELHPPIMETLTAFLREHSHWQPRFIEPTSESDQPLPEVTWPPPRLRADFQAVATVIGNRVLDHDRKGHGLDLREVDLGGAIIPGAHLEGANLINANLQYARLEGVHLQMARLDSAYLMRAKLKGAHLEEATLTGAFLMEANLDGALIIEADLSEANLEEASLAGTSLKRSTLDDVDLRRTRLFRLNPKLGVQLADRADLEEASLVRGNLTGVNLADVNLKGAKLTGAFLHEATFGGADLEGAVLRDAVLSGADLGGVAGLTQEQLDSAVCDRLTLAPAGLTVKPAHL